MLYGVDCDIGVNLVETNLSLGILRGGIMKKSDIINALEQDMKVNGDDHVFVECVVDGIRMLCSVRTARTIDDGDDKFVIHWRSI